MQNRFVGGGVSMEKRTTEHNSHPPYPFSSAQTRRKVREKWYDKRKTIRGRGKKRAPLRDNHPEDGGVG